MDQYIKKLSKLLEENLVNEALDLTLEEYEKNPNDYLATKIAELYALTGQGVKLTDFLAANEANKQDVLLTYMRASLIDNDFSNIYTLEEQVDIVNSSLDYDLKAIENKLLDLTDKKLRWKNYEIKLPTVGSTNDYLKDKIKEGANTKIVSSEEQVKGKGQRNNKFVSLKGGLYISIKIYVDRENLTYVTARVATVCADAIKKATGKDVEIKWLNDLYYNDKKLAGILCESKIDMDNKNDYVIAGIGMNLIEDEKMPDDIKEIATSLMDKDTDIALDDLIENIKYYLVPGILAIEEGIDTEALIEDYNDMLYKKESYVTIYNETNEKTGVLVGVDDKIDLLLMENDMINAYSYGDYRLKAK